MQPKIHKHVLCANNVFTILQKHKKGGCDFTGGGGKQPLCFLFLKVVQKRYWCVTLVGYIAYIFVREVDASTANLLKRP